MRTIWKCELGTDKTVFELPEGAQALSVDVRRGQPVIYFEVDTEKPLVMTYVDIGRCGYPLMFPGRFIGSYQTHEGAFQFHVFQRDTL